MNFDLLEQAKNRIPSIPVLVNMCSIRVKQLNQGLRPLVRPNPGEGKLVSQVDFDTLERRGLGHR